MGAAGFWIGFISGLSVAAVLMSVRLGYVAKRYRRQIFQQQVDSAS